MIIVLSFKVKVLREGILPDLLFFSSKLGVESSHIFAFDRGTYEAIQVRRHGKIIDDYELLQL